MELSGYGNYMAGRINLLENGTYEAQFQDGPLGNGNYMAGRISLLGNGTSEA